MNVRFARNVQIVNTRNRILSQNIRMSLDTRHTDLNNNIVVIGGSGSGKTYRFVKPQLMQLATSYIVTDPKGELFRDTSSFMKQNGYVVKVLNLLNEDEMLKSSHFNPFRYIQSEVDVLKLITNLISNTTPKGSTTNDPFWEKAEAMLLQALFYYVWLEGVPEGMERCKKSNGEDDVKRMLELIHDPEVEKKHNVRAVMELLKYAEFKEDPKTGAKLDSTLDIIMRDLEKISPNHKAVLNFNKVMRGAADTVRSIIISANARLAPVQTEAILSILDDDEIDIPLLGTRKTIVYCVIPDNDTTYNFIVGMLYKIMFQQLYYEADFVHGGSLPVPVTFLLDEFDNVALPEDFLSLLSTMRSRNISSVIIIQDLSQIKTRYKDGEHEKMLANCDVWVYLGGNGPGTQKELSELMGKATIDKKSSGETLGVQGNSSRNYDVIGRELMFPDELRKLDSKVCILFIRGFNPILDKKIESRKHPLWKQMCAAQRGPLFDARIERLRNKAVRNAGMRAGFVDPTEFAHLQLLDKKAMKHYKEEVRVAEMLKEDIPEKPQSHIWELTLEEIGVLNEKLQAAESAPVMLNEDLLNTARALADEKIAKQIKENEELEKSRINVREFTNPEEALVFAKLKNSGFGEGQTKKILTLTDGYMSMEEILAVFDPEMDMDTVNLMVDLIMQHT
ncbi:MAG: VirD4-like conjugal transfer protein, CD1115 family [Roseburia sp.]